jgi:hypothetical protein
METRRVTALVAKTEFVPGYGMVTFDPDSKRDELRMPAVPVSVIPTLVERKWVADDIEEDVQPEPAAKPAKGRKPAAKPASDGEGNESGADDGAPVVDADAPPA